MTALNNVTKVAELATGYESIQSLLGVRLLSG